jgi:hypothetical protein
MPEELPSSSPSLSPGVEVDTLVVVMVSRSPLSLVLVTTAMWVEVTGLAVVRVSFSAAVLLASSLPSVAVLLVSSFWFLLSLAAVVVVEAAAFVDSAAVFSSVAEAAAVDSVSAADSVGGGAEVSAGLLSAAVDFSAALVVGLALVGEGSAAVVSTVSSAVGSASVADAFEGSSVA